MAIVYCSAIYSFYTENVTIQRIKWLDCKGSNLYASGGTSATDLSANIVVEDCVATTTQYGNANGAGITVGGWDGIIIRRNRFVGRLARGGIEGGQHKNSDIYDNYIDLETFSGDESQYGMYTLGLENGRVFNNYIRVTKAGFCIGVDSDASNIPAGKNAQIYNNTLINDVADGIGSQGVHIQASSLQEQSNIAVYNNYIRAAYSVALLGKIPDGITIYDNTCDFGDDQTIVGEVCSGWISGAPGLAFDTTAKRVSVLNNHVIRGQKPNVNNPLAKAVNFVGWTNAVHKQLQIEHTNFGPDLRSSMTHAIDGHTPDPNPRVDYDPLGYSYPTVAFDNLAAGASSTPRAISIAGLIATDEVYCITDKPLPVGIEVQITIGTPPAVTWVVKNHTANEIDVPANCYRFWVRRQAIV